MISNYAGFLWLGTGLILWKMVCLAAQVGGEVNPARKVRKHLADH